MDNDRWYESVESDVFTVVTHRMKKALDGKTKKAIKFTTEGQSDAQPYFPTCYIHSLSPLETGGDLYGRSINAIISTMEVIVYSDNKKECNTIVNEAVYQMKQIGFSVTSMPILTEDGKVSNGVCRFRRVIGADDTDLTAKR